MLAGHDSVAVVQHLAHEQHLAGDKDFLNAIVAAHVFEVSLAKANVDVASSADFEICERLLSNPLCRTRRDRRLGASKRVCLYESDLWTEIWVGRPHFDANGICRPDEVVVSENVIGLSR